jgi:hypothetical protein
MRFLKASLIAIIGSIVANLVILFALKPFVINPAMPLHALNIGPVAGLTVLGALGTIVLYAIMRAFMSRPNVPFIWISVVVLLLSFIPDYLVIGVTTGLFAGGTVATASTLALMHIVSAIIIVWALVKVWGSKTA